MNFLFSLFYVFLISSLSVLHAQTLEEGKKFMYYERFTSAKSVFQKLVASNPDNEESVYWLGQSMVASDEHNDKDVMVAKSMYLSKLALKPNSALLLAGVGHMELLEGKTQDARSHFETAISLSQGKSIPVLDAIGFANGNPNAKYGDASYAIDKLKLATQIKGFKDPGVYVNLGDAYRKFTDGGSAVRSYEEALKIDPIYARASYRIGKVYESQGLNQKDLFLKYYDEAIQKDVKYAPVYANLFNFYYQTDTREAGQYLNKMIEYSDADKRSCYYKALLQYRLSLFLNAINQADECIKAEGAEPYPNLFGLKALAYNRLGDSVETLSAFAEYFKYQSPEKIGAGDYLIYANNLMKFPGREEEAGKWVEKAVEIDSLESNKVADIKSIASIYESRKQFKSAADWYVRILDVKSNYGKTDLYNAGYDYYRSGFFNESINVFNKYVAKYPEDIFGYYMLGKCNAGIDSTGVQGFAVPFYQKVIDIGEKEIDTSKVKDKLLVAYKYLTEYYYNIKKEQAPAIQNIEKAINLTPADEELKKVRDMIKNNDPKAVKKKPLP